MKIKSEWFQGTCEAPGSHPGNSVSWDEEMERFACVSHHSHSSPGWLLAEGHFREIPGSITSFLIAQTAGGVK